MTPDDFAVFVLSHNRPDDVATVTSLQKAGYSGRLYVVVDTRDPALLRYKEAFKDRLLVFDKDDVSFDQCDNFADRRSVVYARNASWALAEQVGAKMFLQLDDDYVNFSWRFDSELRYVPATRLIKNFDAVCVSMLRFLETSGAASVAFAQGGDFVGGVNGSNDACVVPQLKRKVMNSFFCRTDRPFKFLGRVNEDVNTYTALANVGTLFLTVTQLGLVQRQTQQTAGGMTELYLTSGTYVKSFYSVMVLPSAVKVSVLHGQQSSRLHHKVSWRHAVPKIVRESLRKEGRQHG